jgi:outer membrane immunogenic protein
VNVISESIFGGIKVKKLLGLAIAAAFFAAPALAADMPVKAKAPPPPPITPWAGFYIGGTVGGGWARSNQTDISGTSSGNYNQSGVLGGGTIGYNWQIQNLVWGVEADISASNVNGSINKPGLCTAGGGTVCFTNMQWFTTERGRMGWALDNWLLYGTVGVIGANIKTGQMSCATPVLGATASCGTITEWSGVGGVGAEVMLAPHWSAKLEWLYTSFGTKTAYTVFIPVQVKEANVNIVRAGVNWHF